MWWKLNRKTISKEIIVKRKEIKMKEVIVTREYLKSLLIAWKEDKITAEDVHNTAENLFHNDIIIDSNEEGNSVTSSILEELDMLNINLRTKDDIDAYLEFLETPLNKFNEGLTKLQQYINSINLSKRIKDLKGIKPYLV